MPRGGWLREVRRWACCGLRRTGGPSPGFGAFSSSPYTVPLCWVWGPGIAVLWSCQRIDVCDSVRLLYLLTYLPTDARLTASCEPSAPRRRECEPAAEPGSRRPPPLP